MKLKGEWAFVSEVICREPDGSQKKTTCCLDFELLFLSKDSITFFSYSPPPPPRTKSRWGHRVPWISISIIYHLTKSANAPLFCAQSN